MTLWDLKSNQKAYIKEISSESPQYDKLLSYGFKPDHPIKFLYKMALNGPRVYQIGESIYSLSHSMAKNIMISLDDPENNFEDYLSKKLETLASSNQHKSRNMGLMYASHPSNNNLVTNTSSLKPLNSVYARHPMLKPLSLVRINNPGLKLLNKH